MRTRPARLRVVGGIPHLPRLGRFLPKTRSPAGKPLVSLPGAFLVYRPFVSDHRRKMKMGKLRNAAKSAGDALMLCIGMSSVLCAVLIVAAYGKAMAVVGKE